MRISGVGKERNQQPPEKESQRREREINPEDIISFRRSEPTGFIKRQPGRRAHKKQQKDRLIYWEKNRGDINYAIRKRVEQSR